MSCPYHLYHLQSCVNSDSPFRGFPEDLVHRQQQADSNAGPNPYGALTAAETIGPILGQRNTTYYKRTGVCNVTGIINCYMTRNYISNKATEQKLRNRYGISIFSLPDCCWLQVRSHPEGPATDRPAISTPVGFLGRALCCSKC